MWNSAVQETLRHFGFQLVRYDGRRLKRTDRRELSRLSHVPRFTPGEAMLLGLRWRFIDSASFLSAFRAIFVQEIYRFEASSDSPVILDCGANIGLSVAYLKGLYPAAKITAFEPDPAAFETLKHNVGRHEYSNVWLVPKAVWKADTDLMFLPDGADAGTILSEISQETSQEKSPNLIKVPAVRLLDYIDHRIDFLKLDIEGSEVEVLLDCRDRLDLVDHLFVEFHSYVNRRQRLDEMLMVLAKSGFRYHIQPELVSARPFLIKCNEHGMDQRLNIFAYRS